MTGKYEFPEELRLPTDEPIEDDAEDDGWGFGSEERRDEIVICSMAKFVTHYHCLLSPAFDLDKHIATLVENRACPLKKVVNLDDRHKIERQRLLARLKQGLITKKKRDSQLRVFERLKKALELTMAKGQLRICSPCDEVAAELERAGYSSCGIFVTQKYIKQSQYADQLQSCKEKTKVLLIRYGDCISEEDRHLSGFTKNRYNMPTPAVSLIASLKEQIEGVLTTLTPQEQRVLRLRFGLGDEQEHTLDEVGREFNVTGERIRQIEAKAIRKLRHPIRSRKLRDYLDE